MRICIKSASPLSHRLVNLGDEKKHKNKSPMWNRKLSERRKRFGCDGDIFPPKTSLSFGGNKVYLGDKKSPTWKWKLSKEGIGSAAMAISFHRKPPHHSVETRLISVPVSVTKKKERKRTTTEKDKQTW